MEHLSTILAFLVNDPLPDIPSFYRNVTVLWKRAYLALKIKIELVI